MIINVEREEINVEFLKTRVAKDAKYYSGTRGAFKVSDLLCGLVGEIGVYKLLRNEGLDCTPPDTAIYDTKGKSFDADLTADEVSYHVKTQSISSAEKFGNAWVFQQYDPIFKGQKNNDILALCGVDIPSKVDLDNLPKVIAVKVHVLAEIGKLEKLLKDPERMMMDVWQLRNSKFALRLNEVQKELKGNENV